MRQYQDMSPAMQRQHSMLVERATPSPGDRRRGGVSAAAGVGDARVDADRVAKAAEAVQSLSRSELRSWAKVHPEMNVNGNSSSVAIRAAMLKAIRGSTAGGNASDRVLGEEDNKSVPASEDAGTAGGTEKKHHTEDEAVTAAAAAAAAVAAEAEAAAAESAAGRGGAKEAKESTRASRGAAAGSTSRFGWNRDASGRSHSRKGSSAQSKIPVGRWR